MPEIIYFLIFIFYLLDIFIKFNSSFEDKGMLVLEKKLIIKNYLEGMFLFDVFAFISVIHLEFMGK